MKIDVERAELSEVCRLARQTANAGTRNRTRRLITRGKNPKSYALFET